MTGRQSPPVAVGRKHRTVKIPYSPVRNGNRFFQPTPAMRAKGFRPLALGPDNEASRARALRLYEMWNAARADPNNDGSKEQAVALRRYPVGSIGEAWQKWVNSDEWSRMAASTRTKIWWEAWNKRIEPAFGLWLPDNVSMEDVSMWRAKVEAASGVDPAHKAMKVWRAFWRVMRGMRYTQPSEKVVNRAPPSRDQRFSHGEAMRIAKCAWRNGYRGLACIVIVAWDTGFAPVDCRKLVARHKKTDPLTSRIVLDRSRDGRTKTSVSVIGTLSRFGDLLVRTYLAESGADPLPEVFLFRTRRGVLYGESRLGNDFARIRERVFPGDQRQLRDMRRSGVMEAFAGGAGAEDISEKFGNTIARSSVLFKTYNPVDITKVRSADAKRLVGRRLQNKG